MTGPVTRSQPRELGYAEVTTTVGSLTNTSFADIAGLSVTFVAGSRPVIVEFYTPAASNATAMATNVVGIFTNDNATEFVEAFANAAVAFAGQPLLAKRRVTTLTPGTTYTLKCRQKVSSGTGTLFATAPNGPMYFRVYEV